MHRNSWIFGLTLSLLPPSLVSCVSRPPKEAAEVCAQGARERCFLPDRVSGDDVLCSEGTRSCRDGAWSACEDVHEYLAQGVDTQRVVDPSAGNPTCSVCDVRCFQVVDNLNAADGNAGSDLVFGSGGGLTLPVTGVHNGGGIDAGMLSDACRALADCCTGYRGSLGTACLAAAQSDDAPACTDALNTFCPAASISGPRTDCTKGSGPDLDCDGIPNVVDRSAGPPLSGTNHRAIFQQLDVGETRESSIDVSYKVSNADVYILFDATGTMATERQALSSLLTTTNVVHCAQLGQCCGSNATCRAVAANNDAAACYAAQPMYCGSHVDCADIDFDGTPNNELAVEGVVGGIRCLVGSSHFGLGYFREIPVHSEPETDRCPAEGCRYGDRDEHVFRHLVDMTPEHERVGEALAQMTMNYNWDDPEGGMLALNSVVSGSGHYFGMNRPAVPERRSGQDCPADTFGYPCFRRDAIPVVVMFTDAPQHNGPADASSCNGRGPGCPYSSLTSSNTYTSSSNDSASDRTARYVPNSAESSATAYNVGDVRGRYYSLVGDTTSMAADYAGAVAGCSAGDASPDALIRFEVSSGGAIDINFHLTKNDAYGSTYYGAWTPWGLDPGSDDPTPATDFGSVVSVYRTDLSGRLHCVSDAQPSPLAGSNWHTRPVDFRLRLSAGTYFVSIKGASATAKGRFQLQLGQTSARVPTGYSPPTWSATRAAIASSGVRVLPVLATGSSSGSFVATAEAQARAVALASGAVRSDGTPIWYRMQNDGAETGKAIVNSMAELANHMAMDVSVVAADGPDSAAGFEIRVSPENSPGCTQPHPLVDASAACNDASSPYNCNVQYRCRPGATPKFRVSFTHPAGAPVPPNPADPYGGYLFKLQLKGDNKYLLAEIPVFLIPTDASPVTSPMYSTSASYEQQLAAASCFGGSAAADGGVASEPQLLPSWGDAYYEAKLPEDTSIDFQLCTADSQAELTDCNWDNQRKVSVTAHGACSSDADCAGGVCADSLCRFVTPPKVWPNVRCVRDADCPNGPLGAGDYVVKTRCETDTMSAFYMQCIGVSVPLDLGAMLAVTDDSRAYAKVRITLNANPDQSASPSLYSWSLNYQCRAGL
jgi:hypothetical protein